jgi:hypothetical protein
MPGYPTKPFYDKRDVFTLLIQALAADAHKSSALIFLSLNCLLAVIIFYDIYKAPDPKKTIFQ